MPDGRFRFHNLEIEDFDAFVEGIGESQLVDLARTAGVLAMAFYNSPGFRATLAYYLDRFRRKYPELTKLKDPGILGEMLSTVFVDGLLVGGAVEQLRAAQKSKSPRRR